MELEIKPHPKNLYPLQGVLLQGTSVTGWLHEIQRLELTLQQVAVHPIPGTLANSRWGCLLVTDEKITGSGPQQLCQLVHGLLYIPEKAILQPAITAEELQQLCRGQQHVLHPAFGFFALEEALDWESLLQPPVLVEQKVTKPAAPGFIPGTIKSFQLASVPPDEVLRKLEEELFPKKEPLQEKPLSLLEKGKLELYNYLLPKKKAAGDQEKETSLLSSLFLKALDLLQKLSPTKPGMLQELQHDQKDLEKRNQKQVDKLLDLLRKNPSDALKYAIPLDNQGTTRGNEGSGSFELLTRWLNLSLFGQGVQTGSGGSFNIGDANYQALEQQYHQTAEGLIEQREYHQAAFVYMKLLRNHHLAAQTLEKGKLYAEAASVYLKYLYNKPKAAECYEKGNMTLEAIELYKELNENEKVGDLYLRLQKRREADVYFGKVAAAYESKNQYVKAALVYRKKMNNAAAGQHLLLEGWRLNHDATNCLTNYFANIDEPKMLVQEIGNVYSSEVNAANSEKFLQVIRHSYQKQPDLAAPVRDIAYDIIAARLPANPDIASELRHFNAPDKELVKDTIRFKTGQKL